MKPVRCAYCATFPCMCGANVIEFNVRCSCGKHSFAKHDGYNDSGEQVFQFRCRMCGPIYASGTYSRLRLPYRMLEDAKRGVEV